MKSRSAAQGQSVPLLQPGSAPGRMVAVDVVATISNAQTEPVATSDVYIDVLRFAAALEYAALERLHP